MAEALHDWLPSVIQAVEPWMSASDIDKGARWSSDIAKNLGKTNFGVICLTPENLGSDWILFEAGALSKTVEKAFVCPYLFDLEPIDLKWPLVQFQATRAREEDTRKLVHTINKALGSDALPEIKLNKTFEVWWPDLDRKLMDIPDTQDTKAIKRPDREILEELLELVRFQNRTYANQFGVNEPVIYFPHDDTPDIVEAHLRADRSLKPDEAKTLAEIFRAEYSNHSK